MRVQQLNGTPQRMLTPSEPSCVGIVYEYGLPVTIDSTLIIVDARRIFVCVGIGWNGVSQPLRKFVQAKLVPTLLSWGPGGVFLLALADSTGVPMIGGVDAVIVLIAVVSHGQGYLAATTAVAGSLVGSLILFLIARKGGEEYHHRHTSSARGNRFRAWFHEYGLLTIFVPAFVPIIPLPLKIFIISAGALEESAMRFSLVLLAARIPRYYFLAWLGTRLGTDTIPYLREHIWGLVLLACALFVLLYAFVRIVHDRRMSRPRSTIAD
jgi:membrane protein YqaA with SNARE-associated domain